MIFNVTFKNPDADMIIDEEISNKFGMTLDEMEKEYRKASSQWKYDDGERGIELEEAIDMAYKMKQ